MPTYTPTTWVSGTTPASAGNMNHIEGQLATAVQQDGTYGDNFLQVGANNAASLPIQVIVVHTLPAAGHKGRIAIVTPFTLP